MRHKLPVWTRGLLVLLVALFGSQAFAADAVFESLGRNEVYLRQGPTYRHRVLWIYHRKGLPVEVLARYDVWRQVRMPDGAEGWVHNAMLSGARTVLVTSQKRALLREDSSPTAQVLALAEPGVIAKLETCESETCQVEVKGITGWIEKKNIWGVKTGESFQ